MCIRDRYNGHIVSDTLSGQEGARNAAIAADVPAEELDADVYKRQTMAV